MLVGFKFFVSWSIRNILFLAGSISTNRKSKKSNGGWFADIVKLREINQSGTSPCELAEFHYCWYLLGKKIIKAFSTNLITLEKSDFIEIFRTSKL